MVYGRDVDGEVTTFGTTGYTYKSTFLLYDRATESLWYPLGDDMITAVSGPRRGDRLPYIKESDVTTLGEWRALHPDTLVLLGDANHDKPDDDDESDAEG